MFSQPKTHSILYASWSLHKAIGIYMGKLILGAILQYVLSASFRSFFIMVGKGLTEEQRPHYCGTQINLCRPVVSVATTMEPSHWDRHASLYQLIGSSPVQPRPSGLECPADGHSAGSSHSWSTAAHNYIITHCSMVVVATGIRSVVGLPNRQLILIHSTPSQSTNTYVCSPL